MKTTIKILLWTLASLIIAVMIAIAVLVWWVFTPEKITPAVQNELAKMLTCDTKLERVELTFFSTFPEFALHLQGVSMVNPMDDAPSDTLLRAATACVTFDVMEFMKNDVLVVREVLLSDALVNAYVDASGKANYSVMPPSAEVDTAAFELPFSRLSIDKIDLQNVTVVYHDVPMKLKVDMSEVHGRMTMEGKTDLFTGLLNLSSPSLSLDYDSVIYLDSVSTRISTDYSFAMNRILLQMENAEVELNDLPLELQAEVENNSSSGDLIMDISFASEGKLPVKPLLKMVPASFTHYLEGINLDGKAALNGTLKGVVNDSSLPHLMVNIDLEKASFAYEGMPYQLRDMSGKADVVFDLKDEKSWHIVVNEFDARTFNSRITGSGRIDDLMGDMRFTLKAGGVLSLADVAPMLPDDMNINLRGIARGTMNLRFLFSQMMNFEFDKMKADGSFRISDFSALYDTIKAESRFADLAFQLPASDAFKGGIHSQQPASSSVNVDGQKQAPAISTAGASFMSFQLQSDRLQVQQGDSTSAILNGLKLNAAVSNLMDSTLAMVLEIDGDVNSLNAEMGNERVNTGPMKLTTLLEEDKQATAGSLSWIPKGHVRMQDATIRLSSLEPEVRIPAVDFDFTRDELVLKDSRLLIGYSDFSLTGTVSNLTAYLENKGLLKGNFDFVSSTTDVNYLMKLMDGFGYGKEVVSTPDSQKSTKEVSPTGLSVSNSQESVPESSTSGLPAGASQQKVVASSPFMVPKGIDFLLNVRVDEAFVSTDVLSNVRGSITIKDGLLGLESVLFTASAARMQLNALYHTPRRNHLFVGLDFHLTHIEIEELLMMIPDIDTIMPMLRSFGGRGEFHLAAETYLDSTYRFKPSTLRGVASVSGEDLVLMDGETFSEIAKILMFNKKTANKVDSLAAEFTIFRNEVDIYPFQLVMDKYKAVISGKHNLDMNFNYHISVTDSPLPFQLGVDVSGNIDDLKIRPAKPRYSTLYRPDRRREVDVKQLEIKQMIRKALTEGL